MEGEELDYSRSVIEPDMLCWGMEGEELDYSRSVIEPDMCWGREKCLTIHVLFGYRHSVLGDGGRSRWPLTLCYWAREYASPSHMLGEGEVFDYSCSVIEPVALCCGMEGSVWLLTLCYWARHAVLGSRSGSGGCSPPPFAEWTLCVPPPAAVTSFPWPAPQTPPPATLRDSATRCTAPSALAGSRCGSEKAEHRPSLVGMLLTMWILLCMSAPL